MLVSFDGGTAGDEGFQNVMVGQKLLMILELANSDAKCLRQENLTKY